MYLVHHYGVDIMKKKKKSMSLPLNYTIIAIILLVTLFIILYTTTNLFKKEGGQISDKITGAGDWDKDGVANMFDKCPCGNQADDPDNKGCPTGMEIPKERDASCLQQT